MSFANLRRSPLSNNEYRDQLLFYSLPLPAVKSYFPLTFTITITALLRRCDQARYCQGMYKMRSPHFDHLSYHLLISTITTAPEQAKLTVAYLPSTS
jgi:hypothetical protein